MLTSIIKRLGPASAFVGECRAQGLSTRLARLLEPAAQHVCPDDPASVLQSRDLMERAALFTAVGRGRNLELSYRLVNALAEAIETLGLTRVSDIPDPFRRVWVSDDAGHRARGVALTCENGEIAIICPSACKELSDSGSRLTISYRGFKSTVEYQLKLSDSCLFPCGLMLHLTRPDGSGTIGRREERHDAQIPGLVSSRDGTSDLPCTILNLSSRGLRMECSRRFAPSERVSVRLRLPDTEEGGLTVDAEVRWTRPVVQDREAHGLQFLDLPPDQAGRLLRFLARQSTPTPSDQATD